MPDRDLITSDAAPDALPAYSRGHETAAERLDRNWNDLLQELRVVQTGVQILTGFLLTVPFQQRFSELTEAQHRLYLGLVVAAVTTIGLLIAPVGMHRVLFRRRQKDTLIELADRLARAGLFCLCVVVSGVLLLVFDIVVGLGAALAVSLTMLSLLLLGWFVVPFVIRARGHRRAGG
ncbi:MAG: hypothetical protein GXX79_10375 [Actinomycetales bacterium]|nr:hypothetical protein [Actinomycetales bacterium]